MGQLDDGDHQWRFLCNRGETREDLELMRIGVPDLVEDGRSSVLVTVGDSFTVDGGSLWYGGVWVVTSPWLRSMG